MDSFTERMLERAKARQKTLAEHYSKTNETLNPTNDLLLKNNEMKTSETNLLVNNEPNSDSDSVLKENRILNKKSTTDLVKTTPKHHSPVRTLNIQKENFNMEIKVTSTENVRLEVQFEEEEDKEESHAGNNNDNGQSSNNTGMNNGIDSKSVIRPDVKNRLNRLGLLYSDNNELSSPISRTETKFYDEALMEEDVNKKKPGTSGLERLKELANTRNEWNDEISNSKKVTTNEPVKKSSWKPPAPKPPTVNITSSPKKYEAPKPPTMKNGSSSSSPSIQNTVEQVHLDNAVLANLESQGFSRTNSNSRLVYNYQSEEQKEKEYKKPSVMKSEQFRSGDALKKAAMFEQQQQHPQQQRVKDPTLMSVSERKALFEKNKGVALVPKAPFAMAVPIAKETTPAQIKTTVPKVLNTSPLKNEFKIVESSCGNGIASKMKALLEKKITISQSQIRNSIQEQKQKDLDLLLNRFNKNKEVLNENFNESSDDDDDDNDNDNDLAITETNKMISNPQNIQETDMIKSPQPPPLPSSKKSPSKHRSSTKGDSPKVREVLDDVKRIRVSAPKSGYMYPCLSDIEASATETEPETITPSPDSSITEKCSDESELEEEPNTSFGREILQAVCKNQTPQKREILDESTASDISDVLDGMDDYLDEALAHNESDCTEGPTPPKLGKVTPPKSAAIAESDSFHYVKGNSPMKRNVENRATYSNLPTHVVDGDNLLPLAYTVSFYRKQQQQQNQDGTPVRKIVKRQAPVIFEETDEIEDTSSYSKTNTDSEAVKEKINELMNVVSKQQTVISQASQALNLCCSTIEFSGSCEQVEAERLLLVATQRRQAALHEMQRLKVEGSLHSGSGGNNSSLSKGTVTISNIKLPLKKGYVRALTAAGGQGHHIVCLIRYAEHVLATRLVSTVASPKDAIPELTLYIPGSVELKSVYADSTIRVEVYSLQAQEELLSHEMKYHIATKKVGGSKLTPKKFLKHDSKLVMPTVQSPAGPQAVRSSTFALMGYVVFSLQGSHRTNWTLNNTPPMSPLDGSIEMRVNCELSSSVEHRGFLTMFEDVSGFGAWHRRWCLLKGHTISYWKYPDDERKKAPIDTFNLKMFNTETAAPVSRDICARPHTFLLEMIRDPEPDDRTSLVMVCNYNNNKTLIRYLISADTKEERIEWCDKLNQVLASLKLWGTIS